MPPLTIETIDPLVVVLLVLVVAAAALVNGLVGLGYALLAVNAIAVLAGAKHAIIVMSLLAPIVSGLQLWHHRAEYRVWRRLVRLVAFAFAGSVIGTNILVLLPGWAISLALGLFTAWYVLTTLRGKRQPLDPARARRIAPVAGFVAGVSNGSLGASGPILGTYLVAIGLRGAEFAWGISFAFFTMSIWRIGLLVALGQYSLALAILAAALVLPSLLGQGVGLWLRGRLAPRVIERAVLAVLFLASVNLVVRGIAAALAPAAG